MPILSVKALPQDKSEEEISAALKRTCVEISKIYGCRESQVWGNWTEIKSGLYVEGKDDASRQPLHSHPPIAELLCFEGKTAAEIEKLLEVAAETLSRELDLGENIFMTYREARSGKVIAGNGIVRKS